MNKDFIIHSGDLQIVFNESYGVTPKSVRLNCSGVWENIIDGNNCSLSIQQCGGKKFHAVPLHEPLICQPDDCTQIVFEKVRFADDDGSLNPHLSAEITYDFYDDGTMFCNFYCIVTSDQFQYQDLKLCIATCMKQFDDVKWAVIHRREQIDGAIIQTQGPQRYLERGLDIHAAETLPVISFNGFRKGAESAYLEFFMEGGATLSNKPHEADTSIRWQNNSPAVEWNFQTVPAVKPQVTMQLRNCWGWIIKNPPRTRHLPPYTMYHYLDNLQPL